MKALVVYESLFGNTEAVARAVADGMAGLFEVTVAEARTMPARSAWTSSWRVDRRTPSA